MSCLVFFRLLSFFLSVGDMLNQISGKTILPLLGLALYSSIFDNKMSAAHFNGSSLSVKTPLLSSKADA